MFLKSGWSTLGEMLAVLFVGPIDPATKRGFFGFAYFAEKKKKQI